jgi:hypothetical protein
MHGRKCVNDRVNLAAFAQMASSSSMCMACVLLQDALNRSVSCCSAMHICACVTHSMVCVAQAAAAPCVWSVYWPWPVCCARVSEQ